MQRDRGRCPGYADRYLAREIIARIAMREDSGDERRFSNVQGRTKSAGAWMRRSGACGDNTHVSGASWAEPQIDIEHPAQALHPVHRGCGFGFTSLPFAIVFVVRRVL